MRRVAKRFVGTVVRFVEDTVPALFLSAMVLLVCYSVASRYAFSRPIGWANEVTGFLFIWTVFLGAAAAGRHYLHIGVEVFADLFPGRWRAAQMVVVHLAVITVLIFTARLGIGMMQVQTKTFDMMGLSYSWAYSAIPVSFFLLIAHEVPRLVDALRGLWTGVYTAPSSVAGMSNLFDTIADGEPRTGAESTLPVGDSPSRALGPLDPTERHDPKDSRP